MNISDGNVLMDTLRKCRYSFVFRGQTLLIIPWRLLFPTILLSSCNSNLTDSGTLDLHDLLS